jgi:acyl-CoA thioester hydrolase
MLISETQIRVRYGETDRMGYVYYGAYALYYEVGRVEAFRKLGFSYREMEDKGIHMPVLHFSIDYKKPALYDEQILIRTIVKEYTEGPRFPFDYECYNEKNELLNTGKVVLAVINKENGRPCRLPGWFTGELKKYFNL